MERRPGEHDHQIGGPGFPPPTTTTTTLPTTEICGNCLDDDGNGRVDFEDAACCGGVAPAALRLKKIRLAPRPRGNGTKLALTASLGTPGLASPLVAQDLFLQIRPSAGAPWYAHVPAASVKAAKTRLRFKDKSGRLAGAGGLKAMLLRVRWNGEARIAAKAPKTTTASPPGGSADVTWAMRAPDGSGPRCLSVAAGLRTVKKGVRFP